MAPAIASHADDVRLRAWPVRGRFTRRALAFGGYGGQYEPFPSADGAVPKLLRMHAISFGSLNVDLQSKLDGARTWDCLEPARACMRHGCGHRVDMDMAWAWP